MFVTRICRFVSPLVVLTALGAAATACAVGAEGPFGDEAVGSKEEEASTWSGVSYWPRDTASGKYKINVCFLGENDPSVRTVAEQALSGAWEQASGLDFVFRGVCGSSIPTSWMPLKFVYFPGEDAFGGQCNPGRGARLSGADSNAQCVVGYGPDKDWIAAGKAPPSELLSVVVHEVGHGLGFRHEHGRGDWPGRAQGVWNGTSPAAGTTRDSFDCDVHTSGARNDPNGGGPAQYHWVESGPYLVPVDTTSIMGPWNCDANRRGADDFWRISYYDELSVEVVYPRTLDRPIRGRRGMVDVGRIVVRVDDVLVTDWVHRGALSSAYSTTYSMKYVANGTDYPGQTFSVANLAVGQTAVTVYMKDFLERAHVGTTQVVVSNAQHAARVQSATSLSAFL